MTGRARAAVVAIAWRNLYTTMKTPSLAIPPIAIPLFTLSMLSGGLSVMSKAPNFEFNGNYTAFTFIFILVQSATMCGMFSAVSLARDFETGFARRLMLAAPKRWQIVLGYGASGAIRFLLTAPILLATGLVFGMEVNGSALQVLGLVGLALLVSILAALWAMGVALRLRTAQSQPLMMLPIFSLLFGAPAFVPLVAMTGWLHTVASWNPLTPFVEAGRGLLSGDPQDIAKALTVFAAMAVVLAAWTATGLRRAQATGG